MKKNSILFSLLLLFSGFLFAKPIDEITASKVAGNFYHQNTGVAIENISLAYVERSADILVFYVFNVNTDKGFVIVSADDRTIPVLGYSNLNPFVIPGRGAENVAKWLEKYKQEIVFIVTNDIKEDANIVELWNENINGVYAGSRSGTAVSPLLSCTWNQDPYYNDDCPYDASAGARTVTGCVATAMAQIMKYWAYPTQGQGTHSYNSSGYGTLSANFGATTYNWAGMPNNISSSNAEIARLMYHCGVSVDMSYGVGATGGSSAYVISSASPLTNCAEYAYKTYFKYDATSIHGYERSSYSDVAWKNMIKADLDLSHPCQYAGFGSGGGHTWVCDGYDASDFFHMNWGWGGIDNGFYSLDALSPGTLGTGGGAGAFNSGQQAVIGIKPISGGGGGSSGAGIVLGATLVASPNPVAFASSFSVSTRVTNGSSTAFNGDITAGLFKTDGTFVDYIQTLTGQSIGVGATSGVLTFSTTGILTVPGNYYVGIYTRPTGADWGIVGNGAYSNPIPFTILGPVDYIRLYAAITPTPSSWVQHSPASVNVNIQNNGTTTYTGTYSADIYDLAGNWVENIGTLTESAGLPPGYVYLTPFLTFSTASLNAGPGTYFLAISEQETGGSWYLCGGDLYTNPVYINVVEGPLGPDVYEADNTEGTAYGFAPSFSAGLSSIITTGSNAHIGTDNDYYKVTYPAGYSYTITPRLHDSYNSADGHTYSLDALFSYKVGGVWSDNYDDLLPSPIILPDGGTVIFHVAPYFTGNTGTYVLDVETTSDGAIGFNDLENNKEISVYPNPASSVLYLEIPTSVTNISSIEITNSMGQLVKTLSDKALQSSNHLISINELEEGFYFITVKAASATETSKFIIKR